MDARCGQCWAVGTSVALPGCVSVLGLGTGHVWVPVELRAEQPGAGNGVCSVCGDLEESERVALPSSKQPFSKS